tara:strand:+ start:400 stop:618 length:219 start_codon:yes stop_codon:yes gene_type:complete
MSSTHDKLQIMNVEEILMNNSQTLQEQIIVANNRVLGLIRKVKELDDKLANINYSLSGIDIYLSDVKGLLDD